jgi:hypothetical protein
MNCPLIEHGNPFALCFQADPDPNPFDPHLGDPPITVAIVTTLSERASKMPANCNAPLHLVAERATSAVLLQ